MALIRYISHTVQFYFQGTSSLLSGRTGTNVRHPHRHSNGTRGRQMLGPKDIVRDVIDVLLCSPSVENQQNIPNIRQLGEVQTQASHSRLYDLTNLASLW